MTRQTEQELRTRQIVGRRGRLRIRTQEGEEEGEQVLHQVLVHVIVERGDADPQTQQRRTMLSLRAEGDAFQRGEVDGGEDGHHGVDATLGKVCEELDRVDGVARGDLLRHLVTAEQLRQHGKGLGDLIHLRRQTRLRLAPAARLRRNTAPAAPSGRRTCGRRRRCVRSSRARLLNSGRKAYWRWLQRQGLCGCGRKGRAFPRRRRWRRARR